MLDVETKRRIDNARDILVGKVPDPKSQVEQITIALIYKFMDDADAESVELGGRRSFFAGEFAQYSWANLVRSGLGGHEALALYKEALERMPENPQIPRLFRDILAGAFLPYNDPETLRLFLKEIDGFRREQSDGFGDAFEHILRSLGSQGDAGQFLTPRHIIEFIVGIVDPLKHERVLDPACGTAGFLIAAYEHIRNANRGADGADLLTPSERERIAGNFTGYDISPDMVRLSRVNMHLHGFAAPNIQEYDTLTSEDFWTQYADVILANPPFMSPKGGIRPHGRFSVQSKRSEVLFTDYIAEHLTSGGRAGIIVPEGIIFQSQGAHTQLRKMLVEKHLAAVVSLPAGVFQPYSGVKTSILILDNAVARRTDRVAFFKVESDGFDLGAQRRPIARNDLPSVRGELREYLRLARAGGGLDGFAPAHGLIVEKSRLAANGDFNLSMERYRETRRVETKHPMVRLGDVCELIRGVTYQKRDEVEESGLIVLRANNIDIQTASIDLSEVKHISPSVEFSEDKKLRAGDIFICLASGSKEHIGKVALVREDTEYYFGGFMGAIRVQENALHAHYLFHLLRARGFNAFLRNQIAGANINNLSGKILYEYEIPLPSLEAQAALVGEIEGHQRVLDGARAVVEGWRPRIVVDPEWPLAQLGDVCEIVAGQSPPGESYNSVGEGSPFHQGKLEFGDMFIGEPTKWTTSPMRFAEADDILMSVRAPVGPVNLATRQICIGRGLAAIKPVQEHAVPRYVYYVLRGMEAEIIGEAGAAFASIAKKDIEEIQIPLPSMETQRAIVEEIEAERSLVEANRELMERMASRIAGAVGRAWGAAAG